MRSYFVVILAVAVLISSSTAAAVSPQKSQDFAQSIDAAGVEPRSRKLLQAQTTSNQANGSVDEERAVIPSVFKNFGSRVSKWFGDKKLSTKLRFYAAKMDLDTEVQKLLKQGVDPNIVYKRLKLGRNGNRNVGLDPSPEFNLWYKYAAAYKVKNPAWVNTFAVAV
ncbi:secreted RxLR effector peptide protein, putative [Phytophthora infestans T30-4]|uniref:RxLR effector protein n=2 Tax=Phytophthora infestans TaxID=4787 RepID=D0NSG8_PHYIT|nr:secreted RxLR effector peptide protein, putative [Phytophthora infestans T30-4]EEY64513.1 secreted RxLR effector peptide protein, putative [Phytophthora infestans T30-4]KAF4040292.1 hypothetical protein GN244_ATG07485 [Phytophthora infestans]KAF4134315.1 hypothetical protein GN958_ATG16447 [Phytophthora infestans]|eukprot:XP_002898016.1 secreted RxLR effector peptide protein, putative [Phytophthora infestans T30-4]